MSDPVTGGEPEVRAALRAIVSDPAYGEQTLSDPQTMSNLLKDYLPDAGRERGVLVAAAEADLAGTLRQHVRQGMDPRTAIGITAASFASGTSFTPEACGWVTRELAVASGLARPDALDAVPGGPAGPWAASGPPPGGGYGPRPGGPPARRLADHLAEPVRRGQPARPRRRGRARGPAGWAARRGLLAGPGLSARAGVSARRGSAAGPGRP